MRVGVVTVVLAIVGTAVPQIVGAEAAGTTTLAFSHSEQCLSVEDDRTDIGAGIVQQPCGSTRTAGLDFVDVSSSVAEEPAQLIRIAASGLCVTPLDVTASSQLVQVACDESDTAQRWETGPHPAAGDAIANVASGLCVDLFAALQSPGTAVTQYECGSISNQALLAVSTDPAVSGRWSDVVELPNIPVATAMLPTGQILLWSSDERTSFNTGRGLTYTSILDPASGEATDVIVDETGHDMFCPGIAMLADGSVMVNGGGYLGEQRSRTSIYDPFTQTWSLGDRMNRERWYNASVTLADGDVLTMGGTGAASSERDVDADVPDDVIERWSSGAGWGSLPGADVTQLLPEDPSLTDNRSGEHPRLFVRDDGDVFYSGPSQQMAIIDLDDGGAVTPTALRGDALVSQVDTQVLYAPGQVLAAGGSLGYGEGAIATRTAAVVDINEGTATPATPMTFTRAHASGVALPTGEVLVVGGLRTARIFSDIGAVMHPEIWDPRTDTWTTLRPMAVPRTYHSSAVLIPDGRVFVGGGGLCGECKTNGESPAGSGNHFDGEFLEPPYLFRGPRPAITDAPREALYGEPFTVTTDGDVASFVMVRMSSSTHTTNNDQRVLQVPAEVAAGDGRWTLTAPADGNIAPPGYYMVFAMSEADVPSVAAIVRVDDTRLFPAPEPDPTPTPTATPPSGGGGGGGGGGASGVAVVCRHRRPRRRLRPLLRRPPRRSRRPPPPIPSAPMTSRRTVLMTRRSRCPRHASPALRTTGSPSSGAAPHMWCCHGTMSSPTR